VFDPRGPCDECDFRTEEQGARGAEESGAAAFPRLSGSKLGRSRFNDLWELLVSIDGLRNASWLRLVMKVFYKHGKNRKKK
jgi:hypothetical protein